MAILKTYNNQKKQWESIDFSLKESLIYNTQKIIDNYNNSIKMVASDMFEHEYPFVSEIGTTNFDDSVKIFSATEQFSSNKLIDKPDYFSKFIYQDNSMLEKINPNEILITK